MTRAIAASIPGVKFLLLINGLKLITYFLLKRTPSQIWFYLSTIITIIHKKGYNMMLFTFVTISFDLLDGKIGLQ
jgi:hypothetical protein